MADRDKVEIKLFRFVQKVYQNIGIFPLKSNQSRRRRFSINLRKWLLIFCHAQLFITSAAYLLLEANSNIEYGMTFFICSTVALSMFVYSILVWQMRNILNFIENCEQFMGKSECSGVFDTIFLHSNKKHIFPLSLSFDLL